MRTLVLLLVLIASSDLYAQSVLDSLRQPTATAELDSLNQANQAAQSSANAASKRATLLQRRSDALREQVSQLEDEIEKLRAEHKALKAAVVDCRENLLVILELIEKRDFSAIAAPLETLKATYNSKLLPMLVTKEPTSAVDPKSEASGDKKVEAPSVANPEASPSSPIQPADSQPAKPKIEQVPERR